MHIVSMYRVLLPLMLGVFCGVEGAVSREDGERHTRSGRAVPRCGHRCLGILSCVPLLPLLCRTGRVRVLIRHHCSLKS